MLARLGIAGRLILIVLLLILAYITLGIGIAAVTRESQDFATSRLAVPQQTAAIVALLDSSNPGTWSAIAKAVATPEFSLTIADAVPPLGTLDRRMPGAEWLVSDFLDAKDRTVEVVRHHSSSHGLLRRAFERLSPDSRVPVSISIELANGRFAVFNLSGPTTQRIFGIPYGFWAGVIGFLLSALAVAAIAREARPLRRLSRAVQEFAESGAPQTVEASGAPEIRGLIGSFNVMQRRIAALLEGRALLLGAISHDLRTLLTRLRLRVEQIPDATHREKATSDIDDMTAMIDDSIALARGIAASDRRELLNLETLIFEVIDGFDPTRVAFAGPSTGDFRIDGDPVALRRVVCNLIDNALQYAEHCRVALSAGDGTLKLVVEDDGPGVPPNKRDLIFEPFYRVDAARTRERGSSGLGLAIARNIVEAHRGKISVEDSSLGGARFTVALPAHTMP